MSFVKNITMIFLLILILLYKPNWCINRESLKENQDLVIANSGWTSCTQFKEEGGAQVVKYYRSNIRLLEPYITMIGASIVYIVLMML